MSESAEEQTPKPYLPTDEELTAIPSAPFLQDCITVPDGGLVFRTTTGKPLLSIAPSEGGSRLHLYGAGSAPDVQIVATSTGCTIHLAQQGQSVLSLSASEGNANIVTRNPEGAAVSVLTTEAGGASLGLYDAAGQLVHLSSSAGPSVCAIDSAHFPPGMTRN